MVSLYLLPVPGFHIRPFRIRGRPELIRLRQSQRDQAKSTKVDAPRIDIRLGDLDLFTCKAYAQPAVLIEIRRRLQLATDNGSQCATHLRRFHPFGQNMHQSSLS